MIRVCLLQVDNTKCIHRFFPSLRMPRPCHIGEGIASAQAGVYARQTFAFYTNSERLHPPKEKMPHEAGSERYVRSRMAVRPAPMASKEIPI